MKVEFKNAQINYEVHGEGPALVFLHGFLEELSIWKDLTDKLSDKYKIIAIDLLGHGQSGSVSEIHTMELMAEAVGLVLEVNTIENALVFGHSMGGYVALALAENYPYLVKGICLVNSSALEDSPQKRIDRERAVEAVLENYPLFVSVAIPNLFSEKNRSIFVDEISELKEKALKIPEENVVAAIRGMKMRPNREHILLKFRSKSLVILGEEDSVLNLEIQKKYLDEIEVPFCLLNGGHMSFIEEKSELYYNILHFIEKN